MSNLLASKAVLASLTIRQWSARRIDHKITRETNAQYGAAADAGRFNKLLIAKSGLERLQKIAGEARLLHLEMTLPWSNDGQRGPRLLPAKLYLEYVKKFRELKESLDGEADAFAEAYPALVEDAKQRLNGMFREADYPDPRYIRGLFSFDVKILPCPTSGDFRVTLNDEALDELRRDVEQQTREALQAAVKEARERVVTVVGHMAERLKSFKPARTNKKGDKIPAEGSFHDTLVSNIADLVELLPAFNLDNDKKFAELIKRMKSELCAEEPDKLRKDPAVRKSVKKSAEQILAEVSQLI